MVSSQNLQIVSCIFLVSMSYIVSFHIPCPSMLSFRQSRSSVARDISRKFQRYQQSSPFVTKLAMTGGKTDHYLFAHFSLPLLSAVLIVTSFASV